MCKGITPTYLHFCEMVWVAHFHQQTYSRFDDGFKNNFDSLVKQKLQKLLRRILQIKSYISV